MHDKLEDLRTRKSEALSAGPERAVKRQHDKGKLLARERLDYLLDEGSFHELDMLARHRAHDAGLADRPYTDGVITGWGTIDGRKVFVFAQDFTVMGGALGEVFAEKLHKVMDLAGVIPQISVIMGPCAGGAVYSPAMTDFIFMVRDSSHMFITGPDVVKTVTGEDVTLEELGGAGSHSTKSGVATFVAADEKAVLDDVRYLMSFLPSNNLDAPPVIEATDESDRWCPSLRDLMPESPNVPYDMKQVIGEVVDDGDFFEYHAAWAGSIVCGFARLNGRSVGIVGNQPMVMAGVLDIESSEKAARFVRFCDAFNIPLLTFVDVPGFLPGVDQEHGGIIRHVPRRAATSWWTTTPSVWPTPTSRPSGASWTR